MKQAERILLPLFMLGAVMLLGALASALGMICWMLVKMAHEMGGPVIAWMVGIGMAGLAVMLLAVFAMDFISAREPGCGRK